MVDADVVVEWDVDNDGDFDEDVEDVTTYLVGIETTSGRDWPSQLSGRAGPGQLRMTLLNPEGRFSYFNASSPLNTGDFSLKTGRKLRVRTSDAGDADPVLLARDRFKRPDGGLGAAETGQAWTNATTASFAIEDGRALPTLAEGERTGLAVINVGQADYYAQVTLTEIGENADTASIAEGILGYDVVGLVYRYQDSNDYSVIRINRAPDTEFVYVDMVDVVAGVEDVVGGGAFTTFGLNPRDHIVLGVHVVGSEATGYVNGCRFAAAPAIQTDETEVGIFAEWGINNLRPVFEEFHVWGDFTSPAEGNIWTGTVTGVTPSSRPGGPSTVAVTAEGSLARMAATDIRPEPIHGGTSDDTTPGLGGNWPGLIVGEAAAKSGLLLPPGPIDKGTIETGSYGDDERTALAFARLGEETEFGFLHETPEGWVGFDDGEARLSSYSLASFSDDPGVDDLAYSAIESYDWHREVINRSSASVANGAPRIRSIDSDSNGTNAGVANPVTVTLPSGIVNGDLVLVVISSTVGDGEERWITPFFWVRNVDPAPRRMAVFSRIDAGDGAGQSFTFFADSASSGGAWAAYVFVVSNWYRDHQGIQVGDFINVVGGESASTPAPISPSWGTASPTLFVAARIGSGFIANPSIVDPTYPLNYLLGGSTLVTSSAAGLYTGLQTAVRTSNVTTETPGSFTGFRDFFNTESVVIAVRGFSGYPLTTAGRREVQRDDPASQLDHNMVRTHDGPALFRSEGQANDYTRRVLERFSDDRPILRVTIPTSSSSALREQAITRRLSDRITLTASNGADLGVTGDFHIESINHRITSAGKSWETSWELSPADDVMRADTAGSELAHDRNSAVTTMNVATTAGPVWIDSDVDDLFTAAYPSMFPFLVVIDEGEANEEQVRVLSVTGSASPQTFTVERGVNGTTAASHTTGATVSLATPLIAA